MRNQRWMPPGVHLPQHQLDLGDGRGDHPDHGRQLPFGYPALFPDGP
jgi:hypothetical protein